MKPIGVFDSGIGGLTVVKELMQQLPDEHIVYLGDTAHVPYGIKSPATITKLTLDNILFLLKQNVKLIIVACNTASSLALDIVRRHFRIPIIGVIQPGVKQAVKLTRTKCIGVIGTRATINSRAYEEQIKSLDPAIKVISRACPLFVPLVEEGWDNQPETITIVKRYLTPLKKAGRKMDTLILGCTHYPLLKSIIRGVMGDKIRLVDSAQQVAKQAAEMLDNQAGKKVKLHLNNKCKFYVTDEPEQFASQAVRFLGSQLSQVKRINHV